MNPFPLVGDFRVGARGTLLSGRPLEPFFSWAVDSVGATREPHLELRCFNGTEPSRCGGDPL